MEADDKICYCFHITKRKIVNYIRIHQPRVPSQLSECGGAGNRLRLVCPLSQTLFCRIAGKRSLCKNRRVDSPRVRIATGVLYPSRQGSSCPRCRITANRSISGLITKTPCLKFVFLADELKQSLPLNSRKNRINRGSLQALGGWSIWKTRALFVSM